MGERFPYPVLVAWSDEDECYVARVPPFFGLAAHGDTLLAAVAEAQRAAGAMVDVLGEQAPKPTEFPAFPSHLFKDETKEELRRRAWGIFIAAFGRCWCGAERLGTTAWARLHVGCAVQAPPATMSDPDAFDPPTIIYRCSRCGVAERSGERPSITSGKLRVYPLPAGWELVPCPFLEEDDHLRCAVCVDETGGTTSAAGESQATLQAARDAAGVLRGQRDAARGELAKLLNHVEKRNTTHACSGEWETCWCDTCEARRAS